MEPLIVFFSADFAKIGSETNNGPGTAPLENRPPPHKKAAPQDGPNNNLKFSLP